MKIGTRIPPLAVLLICGLLAWLLGRLTPSLELPFTARLAAALSASLLGTGVAIAGVRAFRRAQTTVNPVNPGTATTLVTNGVYAYTRNPMYLGFALVLAGWLAWLGNVFAVAVLPLFVVYMNRFQIAAEEHALRGLFGEVHARYSREVGRWLGRME